MGLLGMAGLFAPMSDLRALGGLIFSSYMVSGLLSALGWCPPWITCSATVAEAVREAL